jgi:hypothetical protein
MINRILACTNKQMKRVFYLISFMQLFVSCSIFRNKSENVETQAFNYILNNELFQSKILCMNNDSFLYSTLRILDNSARINPQKIEFPFNGLHKFQNIIVLNKCIANWNNHLHTMDMTIIETEEFENNQLKIVLVMKDYRSANHTNSIVIFMKKMHNDFEITKTLIDDYNIMDFSKNIDFLKYERNQK